MSEGAVNHDQISNKISQNVNNSCMLLALHSTIEIYNIRHITFMTFLLSDVKIQTSRRLKNTKQTPQKPHKKNNNTNNINRKKEKKKKKEDNKPNQNKTKQNKNTNKQIYHIPYIYIPNNYLFIYLFILLLCFYLRSFVCPK